MIFSYKAIDDKNTVVTNKVEAKNKEEVINIIRSQGLRPISIKEDSKNISINLKRKIFNLEELAHLLYEIHILISAKITIPQALYICSNNYDKNKKRILSDVYKEISSAKTLSEALEETNEFPKLVINMVKVGEESGNLSTILLKLSKYYKDKIKFEKKLKNALAYPILLLLVSVVIVNFLVFNILPTFAEIFRNASADLPLPTKILIGISNFFRSNIIYIIIGIIFLLVVVYSYSKTYKGRYFFDGLMLKSKINNRVLTREFLSMFSILVDSKISVSNSLEIIEESMHNLVFKENIKRIIEDIYKGMKISDSIRNQKLFEPMVISMISVAEESNEMPLVLNSLYKYYESDIENKQEKYIALFEPIMILILSVFVGFIVISVAIPMFDMVNKI